MITSFFRWLGRVWHRVLRYINESNLIPRAEELWNTANMIVRITLIVLMVNPILITLIALLGISWITATVAVSVFITLILIVIILVPPILIGAVALVPQGRDALKAIAKGLAIELLFFIYFAIIPTDAIRSLVPVVILLMLGILYLSLSAPSGFIRTSRTVLSLVLFGISLLFVFAHLRPQTFASLGVWNGREDKKTAAIILDTTTTTTTSSPSSVSSAAVNKSRKTDVYYVDITPPVKGWSEEVNLFTLKPFRSKYGFRVTDSVRVLFRNGRNIIVGPSDSLKSLGNGPAIFSVQALRQNTLVVAEAYNLQ